jgi:hypothetical protein
MEIFICRSRGRNQKFFWAKLINRNSDKGFRGYDFAQQNLSMSILGKNGENK